MKEFKEIAEQAAKMERNEEYSEAILLWKDAILLSKKEIDYHWATCRFNFCTGRFCLPKK